MTTNRTILALAIAGCTSLLAACGTTRTTTSTPASFETPPNWLDRVSVVAYTPVPAQAEPVLGDYEAEPTRFMFRGVPLVPSEDDDGDASAEEGGLPEGIISSQSFPPPGGGG